MASLKRSQNDGTVSEQGIAELRRCWTDFGNGSRGMGFFWVLVVHPRSFFSASLLTLKNLWLGDDPFLLGRWQINGFFLGSGTPHDWLEISGLFQEAIHRDFFWVLVNLNGREHSCLYACIWLILPQSDMAMEISNLFPRNTNLQLVDFPASYVSLPERKWLEVAYHRVIWSLPPCFGTSKKHRWTFGEFSQELISWQQKKSHQKNTLGAKFKLLQ